MNARERVATRLTAYIERIESECEVIANVPRGGARMTRSRPGPTIRVNLDFLSNRAMTESQKLHTAAHEMGHTIGFRHTNWAARGEDSATQIPGTPGTDPDSVMNGGTALDNWIGLSDNDETALRVLYPNIPTMVVEFTGCTNGTPQLSATWGASFSHSVDGWQLDKWNGSTWITVQTGTLRTHTFGVGVGQQLKIRVRGHTIEGWSQFRTVTSTGENCNTLPR